MESNWLHDNDIDDIWRNILSHGCEQYPSPAGYIIEVDIQNNTLMDRLAAVISHHNEVHHYYTNHTPYTILVCVFTMGVV
jgi:hypothetical protein